MDLAFPSWNYIKRVESVQPLIDTLRDQTKETAIRIGGLASRMAAGTLQAAIRLGQSEKIN
jgi:hypothetical protein